jgi:hypothetical protein
MAEDGIIAEADASDRGHGRRIAPEAVWAEARADYLEGMSAAQVCARHGVGRTALRTRAAREGWRRLDQPWTPPTRLDPWDEGRALEDKVGGDLDRVEIRELAFVAHRRMLRAVMRGDAAGALRWRRVGLVMETVEAESERMLEEDEALRFHRSSEAGSGSAAEADSSASLDSIFGAASIAPASQPEAPRPDPLHPTPFTRAVGRPRSSA